LSLRIAIAKPDWGITGGFELLTNELASRLVEDGHDVRFIGPKVFELEARPFGLDVEQVREAAPEFLRYAQLVDAFRRLDLHRADLVISTQPPSYAVQHPRHLALFSHHVRCFYDLSEAMIEAGMIPDLVAHRHAEQLVRRMDAEFLPSIPQILATSQEVARRIQVFNGLSDNVGVFHAGLGFQGEFPEPRSSDSFDYALCVSRHEFPKRTELFVRGMQQSGGARGVAVGKGGRLGHLIHSAQAHPDGQADMLGDADRASWCRDVEWVPPPDLPLEVGPVRFSGFVTADELDELYRGALCVVAPAYLEDYGLTAVEAMAYGKPLVVCSDGGNLVNFIQDGVNGFVVEPTAKAIGAAVRLLAEDRALAARMGKAARETAAQFTWDRGMVGFRDAMDRVLAS
jgi:glycosyltransferase involved in cell wall biosynthesis